ncbi:GNAT family N-acetyltransferase [Foetidibacter luteolus]|uniref:GNAT family N-acetyltransferase n=1 Tax=Foetidibacter luteolus TaxID=2608880 RepID=UPI00129BFC0A|nr:GNAT family N-acetyltransferase [Foetidibacter luteolus]
MIVFETSDYSIRQYTLADSGVFFLINGDADVMRYIRPPKTRAECNAFLAENIRRYEEFPGTGRWAVEEKNSGFVIGTFSLLPLEEDPAKFHIGYALLPQYWGKGIASLLLKAGIEWFFSAHTGETLYAITVKANLASEKVLVKCGFQLAGGHGDNENLWTYHELIK